MTCMLVAIVSGRTKNPLPNDIGWPALSSISSKTTEGNAFFAIAPGACERAWDDCTFAAEPTCKTKGRANARRNATRRLDKFGTWDFPSSPSIGCLGIGVHVGQSKSIHGLILSQYCDRLKQVNGEFTIEYVELPNGRMPAREFVDSLDDRAAARIDAFIERLRVYGNRMQGKFVKKLTDDIFELRVKQFDRICRVLFFTTRGC